MLNLKFSVQGRSYKVTAYFPITTTAKLKDDLLIFSTIIWIASTFFASFKYLMKPFVIFIESQNPFVLFWQYLNKLSCTDSFCSPPQVACSKLLLLLLNVFGRNFFLLKSHLDVSLVAALFDFVWRASCSWKSSGKCGPSTHHSLELRYVNWHL